VKQKIIHWDLESTNLAGDIGILLCAGYKLEGEKPKVISVLDFPKSFKDGRITDKYLVEEFYKVLTGPEVGMWSTWYGMGFDVPMFNTRLLEFGLPPLPKMPHCDSWRIARKKLKLHNNRLASVSAFLGIEEKTPLKLSVWRDAGMGHKPSIKYVIEHCLQDTVVLEQAYERIKPFADAQIHPNLANIRGVEGCPRCASLKIQRRGTEITSKVKWQRFQCTSCGAWFRGGFANA
jgi:uncharacterized protein YprB with RNaseH-like and TPR domain